MTEAERISRMPRPALVELVMRLGRERDAALVARDRYRSQAAQDRVVAMAATDDWRSWDAAKTRVVAEMLLEALPPDPDAADHMDDLAAELEYLYRMNRPGPGPALRPGPRCHKGRPGRKCMKLLNADGLCTRHDGRKVRELRKSAA